MVGMGRRAAAERVAEQVKEEQVAEAEERDAANEAAAEKAAAVRAAWVKKMRGHLPGDYGVTVVLVILDMLLVAVVVGYCAACTPSSVQLGCAAAGGDRTPAEGSRVVRPLVGACTPSLGQLGCSGCGAEVAPPARCSWGVACCPPRLGSGVTLDGLPG